MRAEWESVLSLELQETKESEARAAAEGRPSLFPYLCLLSEKELVGLLLQVCTPGGGGATAIGWGAVGKAMWKIWVHWPENRGFCLPRSCSEGPGDM